MPQVEAAVIVEVGPEIAFAVSQTTGEIRLRWDPFIRRQRFLDGAAAAGKGVRTLTVSRHGLSMISEYVSYQPPRNVGMTMRRGPWFFRTFGGGWRFTPTEDGRTRAVWKYTCSAATSGAASTPSPAPAPTPTSSPRPPLHPIPEQLISTWQG